MGSIDCSVLTGLSDSDLSDCLDIRDSELQFSIDTLWVLYTAIGILSLQTGFTMFEAGTVQAKNVKSALMKNVVDTIFGTLTW